MQALSPQILPYVKPYLYAASDQQQEQPAVIAVLGAHWYPIALVKCCYLLGGREGRTESEETGGRREPGRKGKRERERGR
jgi:hypothetical protein